MALYGLFLQCTGTTIESMESVPDERDMRKDYSCDYNAESMCLLSDWCHYIFGSELCCQETTAKVDHSNYFKRMRNDHLYHLFL
ncbi:hypothetical protein KY290_007858 [Solanum tuberosum]|uniref:Uncharacterized protein n=1 Tax=Solanum tuberosum TaxID=4113 RepID=A0ABQ7W9I0_SOLTU|nr:hypothetical protein KY290_007858 [Solanum tuberosum]